MDKAIALRDQYLKEHGFEESLAHLEAFRRRFHEEEAQVPRDAAAGPFGNAARDDYRHRQFRERMAELETRMLEAEWSVRCSPGESK